MVEMLGDVWALALGLLGLCWSLVALVAGTGWDLLAHLHTEAPRLEGLLVGILLAWLMARRDRHPLLRVLSAPLKLVVDVLDLAWDQVTEVVGDLWGTAHSWVSGAVGWCRDRVLSVWNGMMGGLTSLRDKLRRE